LSLGRRKKLYIIYIMDSPTDRKPLKEEIFEALHERIISGKVQPGTWLRQDELATTLEVSMTPVREALDLLVSAGLAERVPYRGVRVPQPTHQEMAEAYAIRLLLEQVGARAAAIKREAAQVDRLKLIVARTENLLSLKDMSASRTLSRQFHQLVIESSGNLLLSRIYATVMNIFPDWMLYEAMFRHPEKLENSLTNEQAGHKALVDAIEKGDADLAARYAGEHVRELGKQMVNFLNVPQELLDEKVALFCLTKIDSIKE
jgi:DNA-binding GntR family transcriptional regulator